MNIFRFNNANKQLIDSETNLKEIKGLIPKKKKELSELKNNLEEKKIKLKQSKNELESITSDEEKLMEITRNLRLIFFLLNYCSLFKKST